MLAKTSNDIRGNVSPTRLGLPGFTKKMWAELSSSSTSSLYRVQSATRSSISLGRSQKSSFRTLMMKGRRKLSSKQPGALLSGSQDDLTMSDTESDSMLSDTEKDVDMETETPAVSVPSPVTSSATPTTLPPRPFPPESLSGVPVEYISQQMRALASEYWQDEETVDCTIVVPIPYMDEAGRVLDLSAEVPGTSAKVFGVAGRRFTEPIMSNVQPKLTFELHRDYMSAHSTYLRTLFSGAHPVDLITGSSTNPCAIPSDRRPRLLPSSPDHPMLLLPVPDPSSIHILFQYLYFGDIEPVKHALEQGTVEWEGVARNAEYLGLERELKLFLQAFWARWINPDRKEESENGDEESDEDASDDEFYSDSEGTECTMEDQNDNDESVQQDCDDDLERGRSREIRSLVVSDSG